MDIEILSLFPNYLDSPLQESILGRARQRGLISVSQTDIRDYARGRHQQVDDRPFGGGPGMVMMAEPVVKAIRDKRRQESHVVYLSPQGKPLNAKKARQLAQKKHLILLCGHYEGIDERALDVVDEEISVGDFVLTNGLPAALCVVDAVARFLPGVLGNEETASADSFEDALLDCPHYTRPSEFEGQEVPEVLLSGNHAQIEKWRWKKRIEKTRLVRPDLEVKDGNDTDCGRAREKIGDTRGHAEEAYCEI